MPKRGEAALGLPASTCDRETIVSAAMELLDETDFAPVSPLAVADRLGVEPAEITALFPSSDKLRAAMGDAMAAQEPPAREESEDAGSWRDVLRLHAHGARHAMLSRRNGALLFAGLPSLPSTDADHCLAVLGDNGFSVFDARAAVQLVDRFTLGWVIAEQSRTALEDDSLPDFSDQLDSLLAGIGAAPVWGGSTAKQRLFQSNLWVFLRSARDSANIAFARGDQVNELDRRILLLLLAQGPLTLAAVSTANGVDKAQVSRAIKRLTEVGFIERGGIRSPLRLSEDGQALAERLVRLAELRNRELTFGISDDQLVDLFGVLDILLSRAMTLFEQERRLSAAARPADGVDEFPDHAGQDHDGSHIVADRARVLPPFITLCSYAMRAASLSFKRRTGLSNFDTWVLVEVCRNPPISWPQLVIALYRDQSQAGRTVNRLLELGLIERSGKPGRRHGYFSPTKEGERIVTIIHGLSARRNEFLFQGIPVAQINNFMAAFETLGRNAEVQLAREKAMQDMDRGQGA